MKPSKSNTPDDRSVYLAFRRILTGPDAQIRSAKAIRDRILKYEAQEDISALLRQHNIDDICPVVQNLLRDQIFESTLSAQRRFPEVFEVSPAQRAGREIFAVEAARSEADAIRSVARTCNSAADDIADALPRSADAFPRSANALPRSANALPRSADALPRSADALPRSAERQVKTIKPKANSTTDRRCREIPSLFPIYLTLPVQIRLLRKVQELLEACCFSFAEDALKSLLKENKWECPEAVELNIWSKVLLARQDKFPDDLLSELGKPLAEILTSLADLRHTAVHRIPVTAKEVLEFLADAEKLARLLKNNDAITEIEQARRSTDQLMEDMQRKKDFLEARLKQIFDKFDEQRAEIDRQEKKAVEDMLQEDKAYQASQSDAIDRACSVSSSSRTTGVMASYNSEDEDEQHDDDDAVDDENVSGCEEKEKNDCTSQ